MAIHSIRVKNLLSFEDISINEISDINCIVGKNNVGKSNLLKLIRFFYLRLEGGRELPPTLNSNYNSAGSITIRYDTTRIKKIVMGKNNHSYFLKHIYNTLFKGENKSFPFNLNKGNIKESFFELTLTVYKDDSIKWSVENYKVREVIAILYPFFDVEARHIDLYDWDRIWTLISRLSSFNVRNLSNKDLVSYLDDKISNGNGSYRSYVEQVEKIIDTKNYSYKEKVLSYIKVGLKGHNFVNLGEDLKSQSDGTNSHKFIEILLTLLITLTRREFITPTIYIDEPEIGLHPRLSEDLISAIHDVYQSFEKNGNGIEKGKYNTPYPKLFFSTHSPNILKYIVRLFKYNQQVIHFSKNNGQGTVISKLNSNYSDSRFLNIFSDNEARLFFSDYILFVEGATELELFSNFKLANKFKKLKQIDIYQTDEVVLKYLNPNYSKAAIPFQVIYDADVLLKFDYNKSNNKLTFKNSHVDMNKYKVKLRCNFFNKTLNQDKILIDKILNYDGRKIAFNKLNNSYDTFRYSNFLKSINKVISCDHVTLIETTIEGTLINKNSLHMFDMWINKVFMENLYISNPNPSKMLSALKSKLKKGKANHTDITNAIHTNEYKNVVLSDKDLRFVRNVKRQHLLNIKKKINSFSSNENDILNIYRVIFEGKTDTLLSRENKEYPSTLDVTFTSLVKEIRTVDLKSISFIMGKTGGWVTEFMDFSIENIELKHKGNDFYKEFNIVFPELSGIIKKASSSID